MIIDEDDYMNFIEHHGVKGQKWGVRNIRERLGTDVQKLLHDHPNPSLSPGQKKILDANNKTWSAKFDGPKGWTPGEKHAAEVAAGVAFVGALTLATRGKDLSLLKKGVSAEGANVPDLSLLKKSFSAEDYMKVAKEADTPNWIEPLRGTTMKLSDYQGLVDNTKYRLWTSEGYVTKASFDQKPITFPKGHQFYRLSHVEETAWHDHTYSLSNPEDLARYKGVFGKGHQAYQISWKATGDVKVPDLTTRLEAMRKVMVQKGVKDVTPKSVLREYNNQSGGGWSNSTSKAFFGELQKQGYHAIIDDMDAGIYGETPLVFFDQSTVGAKSSKALLRNPDGTTAGVTSVKELANRR